MNIDPVALRILTSSCAAGSCPTIYVDDRSNEIVVQGYVEAMATPEGEAAVRLPMSVLDEAFARLRSSQVDRPEPALDVPDQLDRLATPRRK